MQLIFNRYFSTRMLFVRVSELVLVFLSATLFLKAALYFEALTTVAFSEHAAVCTTTLLLSYLAIFSYFDLYAPRMYRPGREMKLRLICAATAVIAIVSLLCDIMHPDQKIILTVIVGVVLFPMVLIAWRAVLIGILGYEFPVRRFLVIGSGDMAEKSGREVYNRQERGFKLVGFIDDDPSKFGQSIVNPGVIGGYGDIASIVSDKKIDEIIVAIPDKRAKLPMSALLECKMRGVSIVEGETFHERMTGRIPVDQLKPSWLVFSDGFGSLKSKKIMKQTFDITISIIGLIVASPIMIATALLIKLESKGPVFFSQVRTGERGRKFNIYKFRSMEQDAEQDSGPVWAKSDDCRITRVGRIIRRIRVDELPQLINVIKGDMSFVGPRPERPYFVEQLKEAIPYYEVRHVVKPGVTGWAQVKYAYGASVKDAVEKLQYDIYYIKNMSSLLDMVIILRTIKVVIKRIGSR